MRKAPVVLSIQGRQRYADQEPELIELVTEGTMEFRDGGWDVTYEESALTGLEGVTTTFRVTPGRVELNRTGALHSQMVFQEGVSHDSLYNTGLEGVTTTFRVTPGRVELNRTGALHSQMVFQEGVSHDSLYNMPFGALMLTVKATSVFFDLVPDGGQIDLSYEIVIENTEAGVIDYHLDIRAKE